MCGLKNFLLIILAFKNSRKLLFKELEYLRALSIRVLQSKRKFNTNASQF
jgi:hypothetical protein